MKQTVAMILGGGRGERLRPLTSYRAKPAVPFAGMYRLVDVPISNCLHAGIERIYVLTQYLSASLNRHVARTYRFDPFSAGFAMVLAAEQTDQDAARTSDWYQGTADAVRKQLHRIQVDRDGDVVILSGDQIYLMDLEDMVRQHRSMEADVTIAATWVNEADARRFGVMRVDDKWNITEFAEKPKEDEVVERFRVPGSSGDKTHLGSMGIYVFKRGVLDEALADTDDSKATDFGKHILPSFLGARRLCAYAFDGFWEDVGTIQNYHTVNVQLTDPVPALNLFQGSKPLFTRPRFLPPAKIGDAVVQRALLSNGAIIGDGATVRQSVVGIRNVIGPRCVLDRVVCNGSGGYDFSVTDRPHRIPLGIGDGSVLRRVIIDRDARIGERVHLVNEHGRAEYEDEYIKVRNGIIVVPARGVVPDGYTF